MPTAFVMTHADGRALDVHAIRLDADGTPHPECDMPPDHARDMELLRRAFGHESQRLLPFAEDTAIRVLVTGSSGHLGEALVRSLRESTHAVVGIDRWPSSFTEHEGSITDRNFVRRCVQGVEAIIHAATLRKPHLATHTRQDFLDTNVTGTLNLLEAATAAGVGSFIFTSTPSAFGHALTPTAGEPAAWVTEDVRPLTGETGSPASSCGRHGSSRSWTTIPRSARPSRMPT